MGLIAYIILALAMIFLIVIFVEAHRRIPVQYARSSFRSGRLYRQSGSTYIPLRVNTAGMIPLIFAIALMQLPGTVATYFMNPAAEDPNFWNTIYNLFQSNTVLYQVLYFALVVGFTLFYTMVIFEQMNLPQTLQQQGGFVPGVRPGKTTADYLNGIAPANGTIWVEGPAHLLQLYARPDIKIYSTYEVERADHYDYVVALTRYNLDLSTYPNGSIVHTVEREGSSFTVIKKP